MQLINTQIKGGVWQGDVAGAGESMPELRITHLGSALDSVDCTHVPAHDIWRITVPIPQELISDGVQTFVVSDPTGVRLGSFTLICGEPLADDLRAEISLLRAELDMLKKSFRRHYSED